MPFSDTYDSIAYLHNYYPVRYSQHKGVSEQILAFKEGNDEAVRQFASEMKEAMDERFKGYEDKLGEMIVCIMPSHEVGQYSVGLRRLAAYLCFSYGMIDGVNLIKRVKTHDKISNGGDRSVQSHLETMEVSSDYMIAGKNILILDDVATTGNSIEAVRRLLHPYNVGRIYAQTIGKTYMENEESRPPIDYTIYVEPESAENRINRIDDAEKALKKYFGYDSFRPGQGEIINSILNGRDALAIMPTGAGKSICYQIPALLFDGITVVISPLISLMQDQVQALCDAGVKAAFINSSLIDSKISETLELASNGEYKIIYVAPERLENNQFTWFATHADISMVTVDEAHCISQWGQDFRPSYLKILNFIRSMPKRPVVSAFTATATEEVKNDIKCTLNLINPFEKITGFDRENLYFQVEQIGYKNEYIIDYVTKHIDESGIIYCATRKNVEQVYENLLEAGVSVTRYHAGLSTEERKKNQDDFIYDNKLIMVATNAFGMGIDKSNVRYVIHYNMPQSMENYYQEAGRAGRDGEPSNCILLFSPQDVVTEKFLLDRKDFSEITQEDAAIIRERDLKRLSFMENYCRTTCCLRNYILKYFGENPVEPCDGCGNCHREYIETDMTDVAKKVIHCVFEAHGKYGVTVIIGTLVGANRAKLREFGTVNYKTYGSLAAYSEADLRTLISLMIMDEYLVQTLDRFSVLQLGPNIEKLRKPDTKIIVRTYKEKPITKSAKGISARITDSLTTTGYGLFELLRGLRTTIAREEGMPPYIIFSDKTLIDMCAKTPTSRAEMLNVNGVGENKFEKYGKRFIEVIETFVNSTDEPTVDLPEGLSFDEYKTKEKRKSNRIDVPEASNLSDEQKKLFEYLKKVRLEQAQLEHKRAFRILTNKSLVDFVVKMPDSKEAMLEVFGVGQATVDAYGDLFISALHKYSNQNNESYAESEKMQESEKTEKDVPENSDEEQFHNEALKDDYYEAKVKMIDVDSEVRNPDFWKVIADKNLRCESMMRNMGTMPSKKYGEPILQSIYYVIGKICASGLLPDKEAIVLYHRVVKNPPDTLQEVGEMLGVTRERVRQLEKKYYPRLWGRIKGAKTKEYASYKVEIRMILDEIPDRYYAPVKRYIEQEDNDIFRFIERLK